MAERKEPGLWNFLKKGALIGIAALGIAELAWLILPGAAFALLANTIINGAAIGGVIGAGVWGAKQVGNALKPTA
jgi:hypothetical protein